jgi:perosamine synthetase
VTNTLSPHPRYRLYTSSFSYGLGFKQFCDGFQDRRDSTDLLESEICRRFNSVAAACAPMARTALYFGLRELIRPGQTVILSPLTIVDVVNMVILAGGIPLFGDIDRQSCGLDPDMAESLIDHRTGAILITHLHGATAGAHVFREICDRHGLPLIEDAAQAFGALEKGRRLGTVGDLGIYSFGFYKNINAWQGGMLVSPDRKLIAKIRKSMGRLVKLPIWRLNVLKMRGLITEAATWPGLFVPMIYPILRHSFLHDIASVNRQLDPEGGAMRIRTMSKKYLNQMNSFQAELVLNQLDKVDRDTEVRMAHASRYHQALGGMETLMTPQWQCGKQNIYTYYPIQICQRKTLLRYAMRHKRDMAAQHLRNCADLSYFKEFYRNCPNARASAQELVLLPTYPRYPISEIQKNNEVILNFLNYDKATSYQP